MLKIILSLFIAYLVGSIPCAYIYCKLRGKDIRKEGSGNVGATNAGRIFGKSAFFTVFLFDALKGFLPVYFLASLTNNEILSKELFQLFIFSAALAGHIWTIFLNFKGGKGVATSVGGLIALMPLICLEGMVIFGLTFMITRTVSIGSIIAAAVLPLLVWLHKLPISLLIFSIILSALIIFTHRSNILRLINGTENSFKAKEKKKGSA